MPVSRGEGWVVHYVFNPDHYIGIVIANITLLYIIDLLLMGNKRFIVIDIYVLYIV
jgi:hypothetical protein